MGVNTMQCTTPIYESPTLIFAVLWSMHHFEGMMCSGGFWNNYGELVDFPQDVYVCWTSTSIVLAVLTKYQCWLPLQCGNWWAKLFESDNFLLILGVDIIVDTRCLSHALYETYIRVQHWYSPFNNHCTFVVVVLRTMMMNSWTFYLRGCTVYYV